MADIKIVITDENGVQREFTNGIRVVMRRELYASYVSLSGEFICDTEISASKICCIEMKLGSSTVFCGIPDRVEVHFRQAVRLISFSSRSYTSLTAQNEPQPGIISDVDLAGLVGSCLSHPKITVEQNTQVENYIFVKNSSSLWDAIVAYNIKRQNRLPYIYGTNKIMSTKAHSVTRNYGGEKILDAGFGVNTVSMLSDVHMRIGNDEYQYSYINPNAAAFGIKRSRYYELDYQWLHDIQQGLVYKVADSNRLSNVKFFEYASFRNEQLFDVVDGSGTACDGMYIDRVVFTADAKGMRTRVYCYADDLGQR